MANPRGKEPNRRHFIPEWAAERGFSRADIIEQLETDKGQVSRWFSRQTPQPAWQAKIEKLFGLPKNGIFIHPDAYWMIQFVEGRDEEELRRMKQALELTWPKG